MLADDNAAVLMASMAQQAMDRREGGGDPYGKPTVEPIDTVVDTVAGTVRHRFVFDFMVRHGTQSGSDTYYHHVFSATATLQEGVVIASRVVQHHEVYVSEFEVEWAPPERQYDPADLRRIVAEQCRREGGRGERPNK